MSLQNEVTMLISSCDKFSDLWDVHIHLLNKNWPEHPEEVLLVTDCTSKKHYPGIEIVATGDDLAMPARLKSALERVRTEYVFLTLDDYFLSKKIMNDRLENVFRFVQENDVDYFRLYRIPNDKTWVKGRKGWSWIDLETNYAVNLYPGIWKTSLLKKVMDGNLSPWEFEVTLTQRAKQEKAICVMSHNKEYPILDVVRKGKVLHKAARFFKRNHLDIGDRPVIPYSTEIKLKIIGLGSRILPKPLAKGARTILHKFGMNFFSDGTRKA